MAKLEVVRAVDVGYGNTKYVLEHQHGSEIVCALFPSLAPQASHSPDLGVGVLKRRNSVTVEVNGIRYEVRCHVGGLTYCLPPTSVKSPRLYSSLFFMKIRLYQLLDPPNILPQDH
jgi:hypothetical protein